MEVTIKQAEYLILDLQIAILKCRDSEIEGAKLTIEDDGTVTWYC